MPSLLAPAIAIVGPPNCGKSGLIDLLDRTLQHHPAQPMVHVVKGSPDGTGRYLLHAPGLRDALKADVKGAWAPNRTGPLIGAWIVTSRGFLDLVLVDLGGKHDAINDFILSQCSHYIALARQEDADGMASWVQVCEEAGLKPVARLRSVIGQEAPAVQASADHVLEGTLRGDARGPDDPTNRAVIDALAARLLALRITRPAPAYLDLKRPQDWQPEDLHDLGGAATELARMAAAGQVVLGGRAPIWAYAAAMHRALDHNPQAQVLVFDPKVSALVDIPAEPAPDPATRIARDVTLSWGHPTDTADGSALRHSITTKDRFLGPTDAYDIACAPLPPEPLPAGPLWLDGPGPIWLHLTYSRWLRSPSGDRAIGHWDARPAPGHTDGGRILFATGPAAPRCLPKPRPVR